MELIYIFLFYLARDGVDIIYSGFFLKSLSLTSFRFARLIVILMVYIQKYDMIIIFHKTDERISDFNSPEFGGIKIISSSAPHLFPGPLSLLQN